MRYLVFVLSCAALAAAQDVIEPITPMIEQSAAAPAVTVIRSEKGWDLIQEYGVVPADWINPLSANGGENLSEDITNGPRVKISLAERKGGGLIIIASTPTYGSMWFTHKGGFVKGFTVYDEPLVVDRSELRVELWRRGCEYHLRKWYRVRKGLRCGNEFHAVALREIVLTVPAPCPVVQICEKFIERIEYIDRLIYKQIEVPAVNVTIVRPADIVVVVPNPRLEMVVNFVLPSPAQPIGFVPVHSGGQINAVPRQPSVERTLVSVSMAFVPVPKLNVTQTQSQGQSQSQTANGGNAIAIGGNGGTCPPLIVPPPPPNFPPLPPGAHGPLTPGSGIVVHPNPDPTHSQNHDDWVPPQPPPSAAGGP